MDPPLTGLASRQERELQMIRRHDPNMALALDLAPISPIVEESTP